MIKVMEKKLWKMKGIVNKWKVEVKMIKTMRTIKMM